MDGHQLNRLSARALTADEALILATDDLYQEAGYTALRRARLETLMYVAVEDLADDLRYDLNKGPVDTLAVLSRRLARIHGSELAVEHDARQRVSISPG